MAIDVTFLPGTNVNNIDTNFERVRTALIEALGREGDLPNHMNADLDLNNNDLLNVGIIQAVDITVGGSTVSSVLGRAETAADEANEAATSARKSASVAAEAAQHVEGVTPTVMRFSGDAVETEFDLGIGNLDERLTNVYISGVYQQKDTYEVVDGVLTFDVPPPAGADNIEVNIGGTTAQAFAIPANGTVTDEKLGASLGRKIDGIDAPVIVNDLSDLQSLVGRMVSIDGVNYRAGSARPRDIRMPLIEVGGVFLTPIDETSVDIYIGSWEDAGTVVDAPKYQASSGRSHQAIVIDNTNQRVFVSSISRPSGDLDGWVYEYDFTNGNIGDLITSSGPLSIGHGDFFAVTQDESGQRYLWFYRPPSTEYQPGGDIVRVPWREGVTDVDIDIVVSTSSLSSSRRSEVTNYDSDHLLVRADFNYIVSIDGLEKGNLDIVSRRPWQWVPMPTNPTIPRQQSLSICGVEASASGAFIAQPDQAWVGISTANGVGSLCDLHDSGAALDDEIESISWYWNDDRKVFETVISVWQWTPGGVRLINLASGVSRARNRKIGFSQQWLSIGAGEGGENAAGDRIVLFAPSAIGGTGVYIGGPQAPNRPDNQKFDPTDFYLEQSSRGQLGRHSARLKARGNLINFDYEEDTVVDEGMRFWVNNTPMAHFREEGITLGGVKLKGVEQTAKVDVIGGEKVGIRSGSTGAEQGGFLSNSTFSDYMSNGSVKFATYNEATKKASRLAYIGVSELSSYSDGDMALGRPSARFSTVFAATGTINTSDAREKTPVREMSSEEISAASQLASEIGVFQFLRSLNEKGNEKARLHIGMTVQRAIEIMKDNGLDPLRYGFICHDEWGADEDVGEVGGDRYSFRPDQLSLFIARGLMARQDDLDARLSALEN